MGAQGCIVSREGTVVLLHHKLTLSNYRDFLPEGFGHSIQAMV